MVQCQHSSLDTTHNLTQKLKKTKREFSGILILRLMLNLFILSLEHSGRNLGVSISANGNGEW